MSKATYDGFVKNGLFLFGICSGCNCIIQGVVIMSKCKDCNCDIIHTPDTGATTVKRIEETLLCYPCHDRFVEVIPNDIQNTIYEFLDSIPKDLKFGSIEPDSIHADETMKWAYLSFLKQTLEEESNNWIKHYINKGE